MDKLDRIQVLHRLLGACRMPISISAIADRLQCSEKNAKRIIAELRDRFGAPIEYEGKSKGWYYDRDESAPYELPGLWLTSQEIEGLAIILHLLNSLSAGEFSINLEPIQSHIEKLLVSRGVEPGAFSRYIKLVHRGDLNANFDALVKATDAINSHQCMQIKYQDYSGNKTQRVLSPLTLVYYGENWYLDAWCHKRRALRSFQLSRVISAELVKQEPHKVLACEQEEHFGSSYGIFAGKPKHCAVVRFSQAVAREVTAREWHPQQSIELSDDGSLMLKLPYGDDRELLRDILKFGKNAEVLSPEALRHKVIDLLTEMRGLYE